MEQAEENFGVILMNRLVKIFRIVLEHPFYKYLRVLVILMSMADLMFRHPQINPSSVTFLVLSIFDIIVKVFFLV